MPDVNALVLFDIDGTLLRGAGPHHRDALQSGIFAKMKVQVTTDGLDTAGALDHDLIARMLHGARVPLEEVHPAVDSIAGACEAAYLGNCATDLRRFVCPGVVELIETLKSAGVTIGVVTGNLQAIGWKKLELAGLRDYFQVGAFSQDGTSRATLARKATERALALTDRKKFEAITLIGDHRNDIVAAKANAFRSIAVATGVLSVEQLWHDEPDLAVRDMTELTLHNVLQAKNFSIVETSSLESRN